MDDTRERLRELLTRMSMEVSPPPVARPELFRGVLRRRVRNAAAAAAIVAAAVVTVVSLLDVPRAGEPPRPAGDPLAGLPAGWTMLPSPPEVRSGSAAVWTGRELIDWGGGLDDRGEEFASDGFAFDPETRTWRRISPAPIARSFARAVWTGSEALFWGGADAELRVDGVAYDPARESWRRLPPAPIAPRRAAVVVWTGTEMIAWGGGGRGETVGMTGAAYDPASDTWRRIADAPIALNLASGVWTGREMIVFGSLLSGRNIAETATSVGAAYDPATDSWRELPPSDLSPQATAAIWVGDRLIAYDYLLGTAAYDPASDRWDRLPDLPLEARECYPDATPIGGGGLAFYCGQVGLFDPVAGSWERVGGGLTKETIEAHDRSYQLYRFATVVSAGEVVFFEATGITVNEKGTPCYGCAGAPTAFWAYRPELGDARQRPSPRVAGEEPIPPDCPAAGPSGFEPEVVPSAGQASSPFTISGPAPFEREDGSRRGRDEPLAIDVWFNADASRWEELIPGVAAQENSSAVRIGRQDLTGRCSFDIVLTVPDLPPGTYEIVLVTEGGRAWARYGSSRLYFEVTA